MPQTDHSLAHKFAQVVRDYFPRWQSYTQWQVKEGPRGRWQDADGTWHTTSEQGYCDATAKTIARVVDALGITEAEVVQGIFQRMADGSSATTETRRLNALGLPNIRYYSNGITRTAVKWYPGSVINIIKSPTYLGTHSFHSTYQRM